MKRFICKKLYDKNNSKLRQKISVVENKEEKEIEVMDTKEKIQKANEILSQKEPQQKVKKVKLDKSLIERTKSSTIILTEDNRELLKD